MRSQLERDIDRVHQTMGIGKLSDARSVLRELKKLLPWRKRNYTLKEVQVVLQKRRYWPRS